MKKTSILICLISAIITLAALLSLNYVKTDDYNDTSLSSINIMNTNYMHLRDYISDDYYIYDYIQKEEKLKEIFKSSDIASRLKYRASLITHLGEEEIIINGIDIKNDEKVFDILTDYTLKNFNSNNSIIISKSISSVLDINTNDIVILKLIAKTGHYNAEEYTVIEVSEKLNYNYALIDINNLNNFTGLKNAATEVYIKKNIKDLIRYDNNIKEIYGDDFSLYSKRDILEENYGINKNNSRFNIYILLAYLFSIFSASIFINSYYKYKRLLKIKILSSLIGFIISFIIYIIIIKLYYQKDFIFNYIYTYMIIINIISHICADIKYYFLKKLFTSKYKNILIMSGTVFIYTAAFILLYIPFLSFAANNNLNNNEKPESIVRIVKNNTSENTFLLNGSLYNDNISNMLFNEIYSYDKYAEIERVLSFPAAAVIRTGSIGSRVYTYEKNILENGLSISNIIIEGRIFESPKKEIIAGKYLADYLNLKIGDALSLIAKASRGWLETEYFYVSGIYDLKYRNYDIIGDINSMNNFIYLKEGNKSPYNESILIFSYNDNMNSILSKSGIISSNNLKVAAYNKKYYSKYNNSNKIIIILFIVISAFSVSLLSSSIISIFYRRQSQSYQRKSLNILYAVSLFIAAIISILIIFIFMPFSFKFLIFTVSIILLSFILSILISNYNYIL
ncbi:hypothetical protein [uncultured Brachyspira sp.]|uniref:hypothetical protein n=1 Tax=uncultured Brachyspira sp. TaxID=221953 RepID=UPI0025D4F07A|nr:hypothetical protein [uncultured Brachyspira sp.]